MEKKGEIGRKRETRPATDANDANDANVPDNMYTHSLDLAHTFTPP